MEDSIETAFWVSILRGWFFHWVGTQVQGLKNPSLPPHAAKPFGFSGWKCEVPMRLIRDYLQASANNMMMGEEILLFLHVNTDSFCKVSSFCTFDDE